MLLCVLTWFILFYTKSQLEKVKRAKKIIKVNHTIIKVSEFFLITSVTYTAWKRWISNKQRYGIMEIQAVEKWDLILYRKMHKIRYINIRCVSGQIELEKKEVD